MLASQTLRWRVTDFVFQSGVGNYFPYGDMRWIWVVSSCKLDQSFYQPEIMKLALQRKVERRGTWGIMVWAQEVQGHAWFWSDLSKCCLPFGYMGQEIVLLVLLMLILSLHHLQPRISLIISTSINSFFTQDKIEKKMSWLIFYLSLQGKIGIKQIKIQWSKQS